MTTKVGAPSIYQKFHYSWPSRVSVRPFSALHCYWQLPPCSSCDGLEVDSLFFFYGNRIKDKLHSLTKHVEEDKNEEKDFVYDQTASSDCSPSKGSGGKHIDRIDDR